MVSQEMAMLMLIMLAGIWSTAVCQPSVAYSNSTRTTNPTPAPATPRTSSPGSTSRPFPGSRAVDTCQQYCKFPERRLMPDQRCIPQQPYCCGQEWSRYCCDDISKRTRNQRQESCPYSWWQWQWRVIVGMLVSLIVMLLCLACCYYCCAGDRVSNLTNVTRRRHRHRGDAEAGMVSAAGTELPTRPSRVFNPQSPYAFEPPPYETLPKDPPKYSDIFIIGESNMAFDGDERPTNSNNQERSRPPSYRADQPSPMISGDTNGQSTSIPASTSSQDIPASGQNNNHVSTASSSSGPQREYPSTSTAFSGDNEDNRSTSTPSGSHKTNPSSVSRASSESNRDNPPDSTVSSELNRGNQPVLTVSSESNRDVPPVSTVSSELNRGNQPVLTISSESNGDIRSVSTVPSQSNMDNPSTSTDTCISDHARRLPTEDTKGNSQTRSSGQVASSDIASSQAMQNIASSRDIQVNTSLTTVHL